jgi:phenylacetate-CoA ligase
MMHQLLKTFVRAIRREYFLRIPFGMIVLFGANRVRRHYLLKALAWHAIDFSESDDFPFLKIETEKLTKDGLKLLIDKQNLPKVEFYVNSTGGSTGTPVKLRQCWNYRDAASAVENWHYEKIGGKFHFNTKRLHFWGATRDASSFPKQSLFRRLFANAKIIDSFRLDDRALVEASADFRDRSPDVVVGYPDSLVWLAKRLPQDIFNGSHGVFVSSGMPLTGYMRAEIEEATGLKLYNRYGGREIGGCAFQLPHSGDLLMVPPFTHFVEVENEQGEILAEGQGKLLVSVLQNRAVPIFRYDIGDEVELLTITAGRYKDWQAIREVQGRTSEVVTLLGCAYNPIFFIHAIGVDNHRRDLERFQIVVHSESSLCIHYQLSSYKIADEWEDQLRVYLAQEMDPNIQIDFKQVALIEKTASGKHLYVRDLRKI